MRDAIRRAEQIRRNREALQRGALSPDEQAEFHSSAAREMRRAEERRRLAQPQLELEQAA